MFKVDRDSFYKESELRVSFDEETVARLSLARCGRTADGENIYSGALIVDTLSTPYEYESKAEEGPVNIAITDEGDEEEDFSSDSHDDYNAGCDICGVNDASADSNFCSECEENFESESEDEDESELENEEDERQCCHEHCECSGGVADAASNEHVAQAQHWSEQAQYWQKQAEYWANKAKESSNR